MSSIQVIATLFYIISLALGQFIVIKNYETTEDYYLTFLVENIDASQCADSIADIYIYENSQWRGKDQEYTETEGYRVAWNYNNIKFSDMLPISVRISRTSGIDIDLWSIITTITDTSATFTSSELICGGTLSPTVPSVAPTTKTPTAPTTAYPTAPSVCIDENSLNWQSYNNQIYLNGNLFNMKGVSWFGFETGAYILHGLATYGSGSNSYTFYLDFLVQNGFNTIRIPFSQAMVNNNPVIGSQHIDASGNEIFNGKTALECMDIIIDAAAERGILIMLDYHSKDPDAYTQGMNDITLAQAKTTWEILGDRYKNKWNIFMADILNEPHDVGNWNQGTTYKWTDYIDYCESVAEALIAKGVNWLFMVQGTNADCLIRELGIYCSWGGNLQGVNPKNSAYARTFSISETNRLVWSPHVYGPGISNNAYSPAIWSDHWGFLCDGSFPSNGAACVVGEFGTWYNWADGINWMDSLINYLISIQQRNTYYWCLNPDSSDTGGLLDSDWTTPITNKLAALHTLQPFPTNIIYYSINGLVCAQFNGTSTIATPSPIVKDPTSSPTYQPTTKLNVPTSSPTDKPTSAPTNNPSINPTSDPSPSPTKNPLQSGKTHGPTLNPSVSPTTLPTNNPTLNPSASPTTLPTNNPVTRTKTLTGSPTSSPTKMYCDSDCDEESKILIKVIFWFRKWIMYDLSDIECWIYKIFAKWFANFDFINGFDICDIKIEYIYGGKPNNDNSKCVSGPCLWNDNINKRMLLLKENNDGNTSMIIISDDEDTYTVINALSLDKIILDFEHQFSDNFNVGMDVNIEIQSLENESDGSSSINTGINRGIMIIIIIMVLVIFILFGLVFYFCYKRRNANDKTDKGTTEMISAENIPIEEDEYENDGDANTNLNASNFVE